MERGDRLRVRRRERGRRRGASRRRALCSFCRACTARRRRVVRVDLRPRVESSASRACLVCSWTRRRRRRRAWTPPGTREETRESTGRKVSTGTGWRRSARRSRRGTRNESSPVPRAREARAGRRSVGRRRGAGPRRAGRRGSRSEAPRASSRPRVSRGRLRTARWLVSRRSTSRGGLGGGRGPWIARADAGACLDGTARSSREARAPLSSSPKRTRRRRRDSCLLSTRTTRCVALQAAHLIAHRTGRNPRGGGGCHALVCRAHVPSATSAGMRTHARSPVSQRASLLLVPQVPRLSSLNRCDVCRRASHVSPRPSRNRRPRECENRSSDGPRSSPRLAAHIQTR